jgi:uncharacterized protein
VRPIRIRDPIHGFIELRPAERDAIDSRCFQRLREIRQLAMTHLVYPGAVHSRFEHWLGVCHIAGRLLQELDANDEDTTIVRAAALLHDIGHGPFSHVSEAILDARNGVSGVHEAISVAIIRTDGELHAALGQEVCQRAASLIEHSGDFTSRSYLRDIVSGPSDADKLDYLLRDSYFAGVDYGRYDLGRLIDTATIINDGLQTYLGFRQGGLWAVEGLLLARHHMHRQVYGHKTRVATDIMVQRALTLGIRDGAVNPTAFEVSTEDGKLAPSREFLAEYLAQTDSSVRNALLSQEHATPSREMAQRLADRRLLRRSSTISLDDARSDLGGPRLARILDAERLAPRIPDLEERIASELGCPSYLVALRVDEPGNPVYRTPNASLGSKDILLDFDDREPDIIQSVSEIFRNAVEPNQYFASLYTPKVDEIAGLTDDRAKELL